MDLVGFFYGFGFFNALVLAGILLFARDGYRLANAFMAGLVACIAIRFLVLWLIRAGVFTRHPEWSLLSNPLEFAWGPLLYLYAYSMTNRSVGLRQIFHFIPFLLIFAEPIAFAMYSAEQQSLFINYIWSARENAELGRQVFEFVPAFWRPFVSIHLHGVLFAVHFGVYCYLVLRQLHLHNFRLEKHFSYTEQMNLRWLRTLTILCALFLLLYLVFDRARIVFFGHFEITEFGPNVPFLFLVVCIYVIGIAALRQPSIFRGVKDATSDDHELESTPAPESIPGSADVGELQSVSAVDEAATNVPPAKYSRSGISQQDAQRFKELILQTMEHRKPYLDSELTLRGLANQVGITYHQASQVINRQMNQRFFSFVNDYRIELAKNMMADPSTRDMPIVELALEVGFKSKSSFYDAFKKVTSLTPTQFKNSLEATG